jgi:predicted O-linked N-acetylglucosamine transferase (SPINDLY family)
MWAGPDVASRIMFTDVAPKQQHISRARICDLFLDTPECNAHTTAADILWSGTPLLTLPRYDYKMCSRMAASILKGALPKNSAGKKACDQLIALDEEDYENKAIGLASNLRYHRHRPQGRLAELRKMLWEGRWTSGLFDTKRWVRDLESAYEIAWERWVRGEGGDIWLDREIKS